MASLTADLKTLRQQVEKLQVEVAGRQAIGSMVVWDEQNESSVNQESSRIQEGFSGLIVHLSPDVGTTYGVSQAEFNALKSDIVEALVGTSR